MGTIFASYLFGKGLISSFYKKLKKTTTTITKTVLLQISKWGDVWYGGSNDCCYAHTLYRVWRPGSRVGLSFLLYTKAIWEVA